MSVLASQRKQSKYDFVNNYVEFVKEFTPKMRKIPKRRHTLIYKPLQSSIANALDCITRIEVYLYVPKTNYNIDKFITMIENAINAIYQIHKPMLIYFNIFHIPFEQQCKVADRLSRELQMLYGLLDKAIKKKNNEKVVDDMANKSVHDRKYPKTNINLQKYPYKMWILDWSQINSFKTAKLMCAFHRFMHSKLIRATHDLENCETPLIAKLIDVAFVYLTNANYIYPHNKDEYEQREHLLKLTKQNLKSLQIPLLSYYNIMGYSENTMIMIADKLMELINSIDALMRSDKKRFGHYLKTDVDKDNKDTKGKDNQSVENENQK